MKRLSILQAQFADSWFGISRAGARSLEDSVQRPDKNVDNYQASRTPFSRCALLFRGAPNGNLGAQHPPFSRGVLGNEGEHAVWSVSSQTRSTCKHKLISWCFKVSRRLSLKPQKKQGGTGTKRPKDTAERSHEMSKHLQALDACDSSLSSDTAHRNKEKRKDTKPEHTVPLFHKTRIKG